MPKLFDKTVYKLSKKGSVRYYRVFIQSKNGFPIVITQKAQEGGQEQEDRYKIESGVNIGKTNETSINQQAINVATSLYKRLLDSGYKDNKPTEKEKYNTDAKGFVKPMLAKVYSEGSIEFPAFIQPKLDGVRCLLQFVNGKPILLSRNGKEFFNLDHIKDELKDVDCILDGELYSDKITFQDIISLVRKKESGEDKSKFKTIKFRCYDIASKKYNMLYRLELLKHTIESIGSKHTKLVQTDIVRSHEEVEGFHDKYVKEGYEGAIIRLIDGKYEFGYRSSSLLKVKQFREKEFKIVDVEEASGKDEGTAVFVCKTKGGTFNVRPEGSRELRAEYFDKRKSLIGKYLTVKYQNLTDAGIPRFPVGKGIRDYE